MNWCITFAIFMYCIALHEVWTDETTQLDERFLKSDSLPNEKPLSATQMRKLEQPVVIGEEIENQHEEGIGIQLFGLEWHKEQLKFLWIFSMFFLVASVVKICYHYSPFLTSTIPESCVLIMIGLAFGTVIKLLGDHIKRVPAFTVDLFFYGLLPPIILDSAYSLHDQSFLSNLVTILMYAVAGTLINVFCIGISLYALIQFDFKWLPLTKVPLLQLITFSTAISAVDPVCVLAIFQDLSVNKDLYFLVFGESLLNDAVVVVLHRLMSAFVKAEIITASDIIKGVLSFFLTSGGGLMTGVIMGIFTTILTLHTTHVRVVEPIIMLGMAYLSFCTAEIFTWSGLISMIGCGLVQAEYAFNNISQKSRTTVKYCVKTLSSIADLLIFFFLGTMLITEPPKWDANFVTLSIIFCMVFRAVSVFSLSYISNSYFHRTRLINFEEQAMMAYGGLRGAVAFAMIAILQENKEVKHVQLFRTTTLAIILFTVFILGGTTKPLMNLLRIQKESKQKGKLYLIVNQKIIEATIMGIEVIAGNPSIIYYIKRNALILNDYIKSFLISGKREDIIGSTFQKIQLKTKVGELFGTEGQPESQHKEMSETKKAAREEVSTQLIKISEKIDSNPNDYDINIKLVKNPVIIQKIQRIRIVQKEFGTKFIRAIKASKDAPKRKPYILEGSPTQSLIKRFQDIKKNSPETKDEKKQKGKVDFKIKKESPQKPRTTERRTREEFDSEKHDMSQTLRDALKKTNSYRKGRQDRVGSDTNQKAMDCRPQPIRTNTINSTQDEMKNLNKQNKDKEFKNN